MTQSIFSDYGGADIHRMTLAEIARVCETASRGLGTGPGDTTAPSIEDAYQSIVRAIRSAARYVQDSASISEALQPPRRTLAAVPDPVGSEVATATARLGAAVAELDASWSHGIEAATASLSAMITEIMASRRDATVVADAVEELSMGAATIKQHARDLGSDGEIAYAAVAMASGAVEQVAAVCAGLEGLVDVLGDVAEQARVIRGRVSSAATRSGAGGTEYAMLAAELRDLEVLTRAGASKVKRQLPNVRRDSGLAIDSAKRACDAVLRMRDQSSTISVAVAEHHTSVRRVSADSQYVALTMDRVLQNIAAVTASGEGAKRALTNLYEAATQLGNAVEGPGRPVPLRAVGARGPAVVARARR